MTDKDQKMLESALWHISNSVTNGKSQTTECEITKWLKEKFNSLPTELVNFDEAEKEKDKFVSGNYIECRASFNGFKEDNSYWLEYVGDDNYIGRSDNILNQKIHITPRQLYTLFTQQHCPKGDGVEIKEETNIPTGYGKYVDDCLYKASKRFFSNGEDAYSVADLFHAGVKCGVSLQKKPLINRIYNWFKCLINSNIDKQ